VGNIYLSTQNLTRFLATILSVLNSPSSTSPSTSASHDLGIRDYASILTIIAALSALIFGILKWKEERDKDKRQSHSEQETSRISNNVNAMTAAFTVIEKHTMTLTKENQELRARIEISDQHVDELEDKIRQKDVHIYKQDMEINRLKRLSADHRPSLPRKITPLQPPLSPNPEGEPK